MNAPNRRGRWWGAARNLAINLALAFVTTLICLAGVELYLRHHDLLDVGNLNEGCHIFSDNPKIMYEIKPHCGQSNAFGMRDHEYDLSSNVFRIASIGDSITIGSTVALEETYPKQLEDLIRADDTVAPTEVLNFGVMGYSTVQEVETLREKGLQFRPRVVILQYFLNDDEIYTVIFNALIQDLRHLQLDAYMGALDQGRSRLWRWLATTRTYLGTRLLVEKLRHREPPPLELTGDQWMEVQNNVITAYYKDKDPVRLGLTDLRQIAREHGLEVLVVLFPAYSDTPEEYPQWALKRHADVMALCQSFGFHCLDLIAEIRQSEEYRKVAGLQFFADKCCHETARGYAISAEIIYKELKRLGLLPAREPSRDQAPR